MSESDSISGEIITYQYDASNHLTGSTKTVSGITQYTQNNTYDYRGKRISKTDDGVTTYYFYQNDVLLYTKYSSGNKTSQNIIGPEGNIIATVHFDNGEHAFFYNKDIRTSVISVVDESGSCAASYKYDDFGTTSKPQNQNFYNEICYTSGVYDELTGKYYLNARYYSPATAMFLTQDSYRGEKGDYATWNMYAYCAGNPNKYIDTTGHSVAVATMTGYAIVNWWNPSGWVAAGAAVVCVVGTAYVVTYTYENGGYIVDNVLHSSSNNREKANNIAKKAASKRKKLTLGSQKNGTPRNNRKQNRQVDSIVAKLKMNKTQRRYLHEAISRRNYSYEEIYEIAKEIVEAYKKGGR